MFTIFSPSKTTRSDNELVSSVSTSSSNERCP